MASNIGWAFKVHLLRVSTLNTTLIKNEFIFIPVKITNSILYYVNLVFEVAKHSLSVKKISHYKIT